MTCSSLVLTPLLYEDTLADCDGWFRFGFPQRLCQCALGLIIAAGGTWTNSLGTIWTLHPDGTFRVIRKSNSKLLPGTYKVNNDRITIQATPGTAPKGCDGKGVYKFVRTENRIAFTLISDSCGERKKNLARPWHTK